MNPNLAQAERERSESCWVLELAPCARHPRCEGCSIVEKALIAATWVKSNWVGIEGGSLPVAQPRRR